MSELYKDAVALILLLGITWSFALLYVLVIIGWERSTKNALWRFWDR